MEHEAKRQLIDRLDECLQEHAAALGSREGGPSIGDIYDLQGLAEVHYYLKVEHEFNSAEVEALLQFKDPLDVARWCKEENTHKHSLPICELLNAINAYQRFPQVEDGRLVGVAIVGRPVSRHLDDGYTLEVNRLCTDGTKNACRFLYAAAWRAARAMGCRRIIIYTLASEHGGSLRAAGWKCAGPAGGLRWTGKRKPQQDLYPAEMKLRYEKEVSVSD